MISPGKAWWLLRRDAKRGFDATFHHYKTLPRIAEWSWPHWKEPRQSVPVHVLTGREDWQLAAWMLASWFEASELTWPVVIHDDGTLSAEARETLQKLFPSARIITRAEADAAVHRVLQAFPFCDDYRRAHPLALKLFDAPHFTEGDHYMTFDSDVLFFRYPREIVDWAQERPSECWFNEDVQEGALITAAEAREELGVRLWPRVNAGLGLIYKPAIDLDLIDSALAQTSILRGHIWRIEQTLYTLCASRHGRGGVLPRSYEVSLAKNGDEDAVCRHYVGAVRDRFFAEGLERLRHQLLPLET